MKKNCNKESFPIGRDAITGQFITVARARKNRGTSTVEKIPKSGCGSA